MVRAPSQPTPGTVDLSQQVLACFPQPRGAFIISEGKLWGAGSGAGKDFPPICPWEVWRRESCSVGDGWASGVWLVRREIRSRRRSGAAPSYPGHELSPGCTDTLPPVGLCCSTLSRPHSSAPCRYPHYLVNCHFVPEEFRGLGQKGCSQHGRNRSLGLRADAHISPCLSFPTRRG